MKQIIPDMLLPDFEIHSKQGKHAPCTQHAEPLTGDTSSSPHALVPSGSGPVTIKLPDHRIFLKLVKKDGKTMFKEVKGTVNVPDCTSYWQYVSQYLKPGSIIEVDVHYLKDSAKYARTGDIDHTYVPVGNYLYAAQLCTYHGSSMCSVHYFERAFNDSDSHIQPILRNINHLPPLWQQMEQECQRIYRERQTAGITIHPGSTVLKFASTVNKSISHLVQYSSGGDSSKWWNKKHSKGGYNGNKSKSL